MHTTTTDTRLVPPRLAVPPPARPRTWRGPTGSAIMGRLSARHAATFGAIATVAIVILLLDVLAAPRTPDALPLWLVLVAAVGSVLVGAGVRQLEEAARPPARPCGFADAAPGGRPLRTRASDTADRLQVLAMPRSWRSALLHAVAAASAVALMLALVVPGEARLPMLGVGIVGVLAMRLLATSSRGSVGKREKADQATADAAAAGGAVTCTGSRIRAEPRDDVHDALLDSFPCSDPPSWSALRVGPPMVSDSSERARPYPFVPGNGP